MHANRLDPAKAIILLLVFTLLLLNSSANCTAQNVDAGAPSLRPSPEGRGRNESIAEDELAGVVFDASGRPLIGALIDVWTWYPGNEATTDELGRFRVRTGQKREPAQMRVSKQGYSPVYVDEQPVGIGDLEVTLDDRTYLEGVLRDRDGAPMPGVEIKADHPHRNQNGNVIGQVQTTTTTDAAGRYKMFVAPQTYELQVVVPGKGAVRVPGIVVATGEGKRQDIELEEGVRFEARVVDAATGDPFERLILWNWRDVSVRGVSDAEGRITIEEMLPGAYEFNVGHGEPIKYKDVTLWQHGELGRWWSADATREWERRKIEANGWQRNFDDLSFELSVGMAPVTIEVERGVMIAGRVLDPDGNPVAGATVAPARTGSGNSLTGDTRYSVRTKDDGSYRVVLPASGEVEYNLVAHDGDFQEWRQWANGVSEPFRTKPGEKREGFDLTLTRGATIRGRVAFAGGAPAKGVEVRAQAADARENRYYDPSSDVKSNESGAFELRFIRPGSHYVQAAPFWLDAKQAPVGASVLVEVEEDEVLENIELTAEPPQPPGLQFRLAPAGGIASP